MKPVDVFDNMMFYNHLYTIKIIDEVIADSLVSFKVQLDGETFVVFIKHAEE